LAWLRGNHKNLAEYDLVRGMAHAVMRFNARLCVTKEFITVAIGAGKKTV
jgi:hypothetical protein